MACETWKDIDHSKLSNALNDLFLDVSLFLDPPIIQWPTPASNVSHPLPSKKGRSRKEIFYLCVSHPERAVELLPDVLLAGEGEDEIESIHGHPVDLTLPASPAPPSHGVGDSAHILIVPAART